MCISCKVTKQCLCVATYNARSEACSLTKFETHWLCHRTPEAKRGGMKKQPTKRIHLGCGKLLPGFLLRRGHSKCQMSAGGGEVAVSEPAMPDKGALSSRESLRRQEPRCSRSAASASQAGTDRSANQARHQFVIQALICNLMNLPTCLYLAAGEPIQRILRLWRLRRHPELSVLLHV